MPDWAAFLQAIREAPEDESLRLVFADWLDEQEDPLGEFIRLQFALDPIRDDYSNPRAEPLRRREEQLLSEHGPGWLGPLQSLVEHINYPGRPFTFRRGLVESVLLSAADFCRHAPDLMEQCPGLHRLQVYDVRGKGRALASCPGLQQIAHLEVFDWITEADALALALSPFLAKVRSIQVCLGGAAEEAVCRAFSRNVPSDDCEIRLLQLYGGLMAGDDAGALDEAAATRWDSIAADRGREHCRLIRPFADTFPLAGELYQDMYSGRLADGNLALAGMHWDGVGVDVSVFDAHGTFIGTRSPPAAGPGQHGQGKYENDVEFLKEALGLELAFIRVKEFGSQEGMSVHLMTRWHCNCLANPDQPLSPRLTADERQGMGRELCHWLTQANFVIDWRDNDYWADRAGTIHSS